MLRRACIDIASRLHRYSVALFRYSVALFRYSVAPPSSNALSHKDFSGVFSRLPFFYLSSTTDGVVNNCGAYTCAGCVNNSPPRGGAKKSPPEVRGGLRPPCPPFGRELDPPGGASPPPATRLPPPFLSAKKEGSFTTFIQQDDKRSVIMLCYQEESPILALPPAPAPYHCYTWNLFLIAYHLPACVFISGIYPLHITRSGCIADCR
jgi:hypothetical protein